jgi:hypothetical protein
MDAGEVQQPLVAGGVGGHDQLPEQATDRRDGRGGQGVAVGIDADDAIYFLSQRGHVPLLPAADAVMPVWRTPYGEPVMGHSPGAGQAPVSGQER